MLRKVLYMAAAAAVMSISQSCRETATVPFDPAEAAVISDPSDKMAHCSTFAGDGKGNVYFAYYHDSEQTIESPEMTTITCVLA